MINDYDRFTKADLYHNLFAIQAIKDPIKRRAAAKEHLQRIQRTKNALDSKHDQLRDKFMNSPPFHGSKSDIDKAVQLFMIQEPISKENLDNFYKEAVARLSAM